jgi:hypothetical protein
LNGGAVGCDDNAVYVKDDDDDNCGNDGGVVGVDDPIVV